jgi:DNA-binding transcriptional ArsR family regulator
MPGSHKHMSDKTLAMVAERFRLLGDPFRLRLLQALSDAEMSVGELVVVTSGAQANVSKQLQMLLRAGFVERRKEGLRVYYRIADPSVFRLCDAMCGSLTEQLSRELNSLQESMGAGEAKVARKRTKK